MNHPSVLISTNFIKIISLYSTIQEAKPNQFRELLIGALVNKIGNLCGK